MPASEPVQLARVERQRSRERPIIDITRALFDERGPQDAPTEEIAKAASIPRALIYRHFESTAELFVLPVTRYLDEITALGAAAADPASPPRSNCGALGVLCPAPGVPQVFAITDEQVHRACVHNALAVVGIAPPVGSVAVDRDTG